MQSKNITMILKSLLISLTSALTLPGLEFLMYKYYSSDFDFIFFIQSFINITCIIGYYYIYKDNAIKLVNTIPVIILNFSVFYIIQLTMYSNEGVSLIPCIFSTYSILIIQFLRKCNVKNLLLCLFYTILVQCTNLLFIMSMLGIQNNAISAIFYMLFPLFDYLLITTLVKMFQKIKK